MSSDLPSKPRRKKLEVPIHCTENLRDNNETIKKTYSANFHSKRYRQKHEEKSPKNKQTETADSETINQKVSRRHLSRENSRLTKENDEIVAKFNELEELSLKKILKLKEKISFLQTSNEKFSEENVILNEKLRDLEHCNSCDLLKSSLKKIQEENILLRNENHSMNQDLEMLKTVVYRLNVQMDRYQEKLRQLNIKYLPNESTPQHQHPDSIPIVDSHNPNILELHQDHSHTPISWGRVNTHTLGPLLDAYQDTITEKDGIIENYELEIAQFTGRLKEIIKENEALHKTLNEDNDCSIQLKIELASLKKELEEIKNQNDILIKKCALKQDKLEEVLRCYEHKVEQLKVDYGVVHDQYCKTRTEVAALKEKNKALIDVQDELKNERQNYIPLSVHTSSVNECKKWYEELKHQYEQEKIKMKQNLDTQANLVEELKQSVNKHAKDKDDLSNKIKQQEKQIKKSEAKYLEFEHTLNEVQYAKSACRKQLHKAMSFAKDLVEEQETLLRVLNQRQQETKTVKKFGFDIAARMQTLRNQLKDVQQDAWKELTTVEKRIQDQHEAMETMKQDHNVEIERLQQIIKEQENNNIKESISLPM